MLYNFTDVGDFGSLLQSANQATNNFLGIGLLVFLFSVIMIVLMKNDRNVEEGMVGGGFLTTIFGIMLHSIPNGIGGSLVSFQVILIFLVIGLLGLFIMYIREQ